MAQLGNTTITGSLNVSQSISATNIVASTINGTSTTEYAKNGQQIILPVNPSVTPTEVGAIWITTT